QDGASGLRLKATDRSPGDDPLALWRTAAELGLAISCPVPPHTDPPEFSLLLNTLPNLTVVLEHLGGSSSASDDAEGSQRGRVFELARHPNAYIKIPGLGEFARRALPAQSPFPFERPIPN